jgi:AcrR family transcriptional regulator
MAAAIGVTKTAVAQQFKRKDDVVLVVTATELAELQDALTPRQSPAREGLLERLVDIAVERHHIASSLQFDSVVLRPLADHQPFVRFVERLYRGSCSVGSTRVDGRVNAAIKSRALAVTCRILDLPD